MKAQKILLFIAVSLLALSSFAQGEYLIPFKSEANGKWGYKNRKDEVVIEPQYELAKEFHEGLAVVCQLEPWPNGSNYRTYGYINCHGEIVIDIVYSKAESFHNGLAKVGKPKQNEKGYYYGGYFGYINKKGEEVIPLKYDRIDMFSDDSLVVAKYNGKEGVIGKDDEIVIDFVYDKISPFGDNGLAAVKRNGKYGYVNKNGDIVIDFVYEIAGPFSEGLAVVGRKDEYSNKLAYGYINNRGEKIIDFKYEFADTYYNGLAGVVLENKLGFIDMTGQIVIPFDYDYKLIDSYDIYDTYLGKTLSPSDFCYGPALLIKDGKYGLVNQEGSQLTAFIYDGYKAKNGWGDYDVYIGIDIYYLDRWGNEYTSKNLRNSNRRNSYELYSENGDGDAQYKRAYNYYNGLTISKDGNYFSYRSPDYQKALDWFLKSAEHGFYKAQWYCGYMYENGLGTKQNNVKAIEWYRKAALQGHQESIDRLRELNLNIDNKYNINSLALIQWSNISTSIKQQQLILKAEVKSASEIDYCKLYLNGVEVQWDNASGGSAIVEDENHDITINRTLVLKEGINTIKIKVKNAGGETVEEKTIEYKPEKSIPEKAVIVWNVLPSNTTESRLELDATVKSTVKDVTCRVMLNGVEVLRLAKGSSIVENSKEPEYKYKVKVQRTLNLKENIMNTIVIEVKDAQGGLLKSEQKQVSYTKPMLATIKWGDVPSCTEEKHLTLRAQIISESPIEYYSILKGEKVLKRVEIAPVSAPGGSSIVEDPKNVKAVYNISVEESLELAEGDNGFVIDVKNAGGILRSARMTVKYKHKEKRIALVIGNQHYNDEKMRLTCTSNDADAVAARFRQLGFDEVIHKNNLSKSEMQSIIDGFRSKSVDYDAVVVYFSGHGVQLNQINYLIPTDFDFSNGSVTNDCVAVTYILRDLGEDLMKIVIYDACRTQPRPKGDVTDIDVMNNVNTFIAYASSVGQPSYEDPDSPYSIYTGAFLKVLEESNLKLGDVFSKVNGIVRQKTASMNVKQVPYIEGSVEKDFTFNK